MSVAYLPQNNPPIVRERERCVAVGTGYGAEDLRAILRAAANSAYSITVTDSGDAPSAIAGTPTQTLSRSGNSQIQISWQADDPDGDRLVYAVYFRGEDELQWKVLRLNQYENTLLLDADIFADGRYSFRVVASDRASNDLRMAREADAVSAPVLIDNTPPMVTIHPPQRTDAHLEADVDAVDATSPLRRCEYSIDAGAWTPVEAVDGVTEFYLGSSFTSRSTTSVPASTC